MSPTPHTATAWPVPGEPTLWSVTWLPGRALTRGQAITAMTIAETVAAHAGAQNGTEGWRPHLESWAAELDLSADAAAEMASAPPARGGDKRQGAAEPAPARANQAGSTCPPWCTADHSKIHAHERPDDQRPAGGAAGKDRAVGRLQAVRLGADPEHVGLFHESGGHERGPVQAKPADPASGTPPFTPWPRRPRTCRGPLRSSRPSRRGPGASQSGGWICLGLSSADRQALDNGINDLDGVLKTAALNNGDTCADVRAQFAGHELCDHARWLNSISFIGNSCHPTATGQKDGYLPVFSAAISAADQ